MNCGVCLKSLLPNRAVFRCQCGIITHAQCWEKHVVESHSPAFTLGHIMNDEFKPNRPSRKRSGVGVPLLGRFL